MRLSDFQTAPVVRNFEAERLVGIHARKVHHGVVDYRKTRIVVNPGAVEIYGKDAVAAVTNRQKIHTMLDQMMSEANMTEADAPRLHAALDRLLDSDSEEKPEVGDSDEEEEEETDEAELIEDDGEVNEDPHRKNKIPYDALSLDQLQRTLDKTFGIDDGASLSRSITMDSDSLRLGGPDDVASDAIAKFPIGFDINKRAKASWFNALFTWINKHPEGTKIKDLHQPTLQKLLRELQTAA